MRRMIGWLALVLSLLLAILPAAAAERIEDYRADIMLQPDGTLRVREVIRAVSEGDQIRRGIYRDFPLTMLDKDDRRVQVDFNLISVRRDGKDEPYHTERGDGGIRIYSGDKDVLLPSGPHVFEFTYETGRQIRFFEDHDEIYWNVTGNGWIFPILKASATVTLPNGAIARDAKAFTGSYGAAGSDARITRAGDTVSVSTTRPLGPREGLTLVVAFDKGVVAAPDDATRARWWLRDHAGLIVAGLGLAIVTVYYLWMWARVGRDPPAGVVVPRWDAPEGASPALVNYIDGRGFADGGWTAFSAAALHLAVRGQVVLEDLKERLVIRRIGTRVENDAEGKSAEPAVADPWGKRSGTSKTSGRRDAPPLGAGEAALLGSVDQAGGALVVDRAHGPAVQLAGSAFRTAMEREHRGKYYRANTGFIVGGVGLSLLVLLAIMVFGGLGEDIVPLVIIPVVAGIFLPGLATAFVKSRRRERSLASRIARILVLAFIGFVAVSILLSLFATVVTQALEHHELPMLFAIGAIVLVNALFFFLMGAPTPLGATMTAGIEGLRQYLILAEQERLNLVGAPQMSPAHYETLLPYAVALGVEKPWSQAFETWLASAGAAVAAAAYQPAWYHGSQGPGGFSDRMSRFPGEMASTIAASLPPPPKSSSSGFSSGGGFSGGGGGGGGGGGW
ncbi:hypothetical protein BJF93_17990 [Xaviernesmea oryzae]|uniref:DUF2207 domain-containing protein n=1 Tax=Xaviernesmea oryzae TaxID=464029 RepID=A0A1Q9ATH2_9HYPH|nr:DUF2207 domain-containing protein [Xaviernesmea oryzae]OLP58713.1 hypothetical protein BJF93_17990 [Xaviernesmea oryzae]SEK69469.1 Predicted membrane protein [Xaviernesmea oryzae]